MGFSGAMAASIVSLFRLGWFAFWVIACRGQFGGYLLVFTWDLSVSSSLCFGYSRVIVYGQKSPSSRYRGSSHFLVLSTGTDFRKISWRSYGFLEWRSQRLCHGSEPKCTSQARCSRTWSCSQSSCGSWSGISQVIFCHGLSASIAGECICQTWSPTAFPPEESGSCGDWVWRKSCSLEASSPKCFACRSSPRTPHMTWRRWESCLASSSQSCSWSTLQSKGCPMG